MTVSLGIEGIQEAQAANLRDIAELQPTGSFGQALQYVTAGLHRHAVGVTHVATGALRASHRMRLDGLRGEVYIDPAARNPHGALTSDYGPIEHARGSSHAFYDRTLGEAGPALVERAIGYIRVGL